MVFHVAACAKEEGSEYPPPPQCVWYGNIIEEIKIVSSDLPGQAVSILSMW